MSPRSHSTGLSAISTVSSGARPTRTRAAAGAPAGVGAGGEVAGPAQPASVARASVARAGVAAGAGAEPDRARARARRIVRPPPADPAPSRQWRTPQHAPGLAHRRSILSVLEEILSVTSGAGGSPRGGGLVLVDVLVIALAVVGGLVLYCALLAGLWAVVVRLVRRRGRTRAAAPTPVTTVAPAPVPAAGPVAPTAPAAAAPAAGG